MLKDKYKVHVDGWFVTPNVAKGTWTVKKLKGGTCSSTFDYKVKRTGPATG